MWPNQPCYLGGKIEKVEYLYEKDDRGREISFLRRQGRLNFRPNIGLRTWMDVLQEVSNEQKVGPSNLVPATSHMRLFLLDVSQQISHALPPFYKQGTEYISTTNLGGEYSGCSYKT